MAPESRPAFLLYAAEFLTDMRSAMMTLEARGAYITLLCYEWTEKGLPTSDDELAALLKITPRRLRALRPFLTTRFQIEGDRLVNPRLEAERQRQDEEARTARQEQARTSEQRRQAALERWRGRPRRAG